ncbi:alpha/beta-hydrolase [Lentithecium fluviatile CBS 122367]|uniref:Alpha/beta-hydrolase n=1 Tax=Lentithecium fluviatile CBS 122367 TaxID=1168545 RepID=A0A6G1IIF4_9PLEO|nr:alpha/beta-hydrolase [Lentithecium fluviatile CBS 122367]
MAGRLLLTYAAGAARPSSFYTALGTCGVDTRRIRSASSKPKPAPKPASIPKATPARKPNPTLKATPSGKAKDPRVPPSPLRETKKRKGGPLPYRPRSQPDTTPPGASRVSPAQQTAATSSWWSPSRPFDYTVIPEYVIWPGDTEQMPLPDGGALGYAIMGRRDTSRKLIPLVCFHGTPGCRLSFLDLHKWAESRGIPLIVVERPGYGISTYKPDYNAINHAMDVHQLVFEHLGYERCRVLGVSGGCPFALAMAAISSRDEVLVTGIMSGGAPPQAGYFGVSLFTRWWNFKLRWMFKRTTDKIDRKMAKSLKSIRSANFPTEHVRDTEKGRKILADRETYLRHGSLAHTTDYRNGNRPWGFELEEIVDKNRILMYHGMEDVNTPIEGARYMQMRLSNSELIERGNRDHKKVQEDTFELLERMLKYKQPS